VSQAPSRSAIARLDRGVPTIHFRCDADRGLAVGPADLDPGQLLPATGGDDEEDIHAVPFVLAPVRQPDLQLGHFGQAMSDRLADQVRHRDVHAFRLPGIRDVCQQRASVELQVTEELWIHRAAPGRSC
jgi:hypothetical protein